MPVEREVRDREGRWYALRIRPYRSADNKIDGAVVALFDIDVPKRHEASLRSLTELTQALLRVSPTPMALLDANLGIRSVNAPFVALFGVNPEAVQGRPLTEVVHAESGLDRFATPSHGDGSPPVTVELRPPAGQAPVAFQAHTFPAHDGAPGHVVLLIGAESQERSSTPS